MNFESAENVRSSNVVKFECELRHIPTAHLTVEFLLLRDNSLDLALKLVNLYVETVDRLLQTYSRQSSVQPQSLEYLVFL